MLRHLLVSMALVLVLSACEEEKVAVCGDGRRQGAEICDGTDLGTAACGALGYHAGEVACSDACTLDVSACSGRCGDGALDLGFEECEAALPSELTCRDLGYHGGEVGCVDCQLDLRDCEARGWCGDGVLQDWEGETCDGAALIDVACGTEWTSSPNLGCGPDCRLDASGCDGFRRLGSTQYDAAQGVGVDLEGGLLVAGYTYGALTGASAHGGGDAFVARYGPDGTRLWVSQLGTSRFEFGEAVKPWVDDLGNGTVLVGGSTQGNLGGQPNAGSLDAFVSAFLLDGTPLWTRLHGSAGEESFRQITGRTDGDVYAVGYASGAVDGAPAFGGKDVLVVRMTASGDPVWTRIYGTAQDDVALRSAPDGADGLYVTGYTRGAFPGETAHGEQDALLLRIDADGTLLWARQWGSSGTDLARDVTVGDAGAAILVGVTEDPVLLGADELRGDRGLSDLFVLRCSAEGEQEWVLAAGTTGYDDGMAITADPIGWIYVAGYTQGHFLGGVNAGSVDGVGYASDVVLLKLHFSGQLRWSRQLGGLGIDVPTDIALEPGTDHLYVSGFTSGDLPGADPVVGGTDAFVLQTTTVP